MSCKGQIKLDLFICFQGEVDNLKSRLARLEREKKELEEANEKLQQKVTRFYFPSSILLAYLHLTKVTSWKPVSSAGKLG